MISATKENIKNTFNRKVELTDKMLRIISDNHRYSGLHVMLHVNLRYICSNFRDIRSENDLDIRPV